MTDFFATSPLDDPLSYPGLIPAFSYVLTGPRSLSPFGGADLGLLRGRRPVVAVGSNAAPGQLARKFVGIESVVAVVRGVAAGLRVLPSAHVNVHGYLPYAPLFERGCAADVFVTFLDPAQLRRLDQTEPNYARVPFGVVRLQGDLGLVEACDIYQSRQGVITDRRLVGRALASQSELLTRLLALLPQVTDISGDSAREFVAAIRSKRLDPLWVTRLIQTTLEVADRPFPAER